MNKPLRVLLLEDNEVDAELIRIQIEEARPGSSVLRVDSPDAFTAALIDFAPEVVLSDHALGAFNALGALNALRATRPAVPLIVVTGAIDERLTIECLRNGAEDVILKAHIDRLPGSINAALAARRRLGMLTPRQLQVLRLVAEGHSTPAIAQQLQLSTKTVETHRTELMKRLDIHDVATLVRYSVRVGIVSVET